MSFRWSIAAVIMLTLSGTLAAQNVAASRKEHEGMAKRDDYSWVRGSNFIPSYAATDVEIWNRFDPGVVDRELGYAERLELNSIRIFLQYHVYELYPQKFLKNVATFVDLCDKHGIKPMLIVFDSCFGVSPSINSGEFWVANPGPDRTNPDFYPAGEKYVKDLVGLFRDDPRILFWDVMNEPTATPLAGTDEGQKLIWDFVRHFCDYIHRIDDTHPVTVGVAGTDNSQIIDHVDVLSMHSYNKEADGFRKDIQSTRKQAETAGKPFIISECCAPGWGCQYEMVMPIVREEKIGFYIWEVMIARTQFRNIAGLFYPDGTVRRLSQIEAVLGKPAVGLVEKPDSEGEPISAGPPVKELVAPTIRRMVGTATNDENYSERYTLLMALSRHLKMLGDKSDEVTKQLDAADALRKGGRPTEAFSQIDRLLKIAQQTLLELQPGK